MRQQHKVQASRVDVAEKLWGQGHQWVTSNSSPSGLLEHANGVMEDKLKKRIEAKRKPR